MPSVNLLPWREERRRKRQREFLLALCGAVGAGALTVYFTKVTIGKQLEEQRFRNELIRMEVHVLDQQIEEILRIEAQKERFASMVSMIGELQYTQLRVVRLFDELIEILPDGVHLVEVEQHDARIVLSGVAESSSRIAAMMGNIEASPWLQAPRIDLVETVAEGVARNAHFTIAVEQAHSPGGFTE